MPIEVQHQPDPRLVGRAAFGAGLGRYNQQQFENGLQLTQLALQERARQQAMAQQQQQFAQQQQMQMLEMQRRQQMQERQMQFDRDMQQGQWNAQAQRQQFELQRQAMAERARQQNYADLRQHQMQRDQQAQVVRSVDVDRTDRMKRLAAVQSGLNQQGYQEATKLRTELAAISTQRKMGQIDDAAYQQAMQQWDMKMDAHGDWSTFRVDPRAQIQQEFDASTFNHPQFGPGRMLKNKQGQMYFVPDEPVVRTQPDGSKLIGHFRDDGTIEWRPQDAPKAAKEDAGKPALDIKRVADRAKAIREAMAIDPAAAAAEFGMAPGETPEAAAVRLEKALMDAIGAGGEAPPAGAAPAPDPTATPKPGDAGAEFGDAPTLDPASPAGKAVAMYDAARPSMAPGTQAMWDAVKPLIVAKGSLDDPEVAAKLLEMKKAIEAKLAPAGAKPAAPPPVAPAPEPPAPEPPLPEPAAPDPPPAPAPAPEQPKPAPEPAAAGTAPRRKSYSAREGEFNYFDIDPSEIKGDTNTAKSMRVMFDPARKDRQAKYSEWTDKLLERIGLPIRATGGLHNKYTDEWLSKGNIFAEFSDSPELRAKMQSQFLATTKKGLFDNLDFGRGRRLVEPTRKILAGVGRQVDTLIERGDLIRASMLARAALLLERGELQAKDPNSDASEQRDASDMIAAAMLVFAQAGIDDAK
jgi:hypothetical protein